MPTPTIDPAVLLLLQPPGAPAEAATIDAATLLLLQPPGAAAYLPTIDPGLLLLLQSPAEAAVPPEGACGDDVLSRGMAWLTGQMQAHASEPVVYQRGAFRAPMCATLGRKLLKLDDGQGGVRLERTDADFLVPYASLVAGGFGVPRRGDVVRVRSGGEILTYEVGAPGGEPPWAWSDPFRRLVRVHAKLVDTEGE